MKIKEIVSFLEELAPASLQESYDNAGLITGMPDWECSGILCSLDATEEIVNEAIAKGCNLVVSHHPIVFAGLKRINGKNYVEKTIITAIKSDVAIYAIHTNLDNVLQGVNGAIASMLGLKNIRVLSNKENVLRKLYTFIPANKAMEVRSALFAAGGGHIGNYSECSFNTAGTGTFKAGSGTQPYVGKEGEQHEENEVKTELIFPAWLEGKLVAALKASHPYEEVAYDIISLANEDSNTGSGLVGELPVPVHESDFLAHVKQVFGTPAIRHTALLQKPIQRVAVCGGAGSFLISKALAAGADVYITGDLKYHEFFDSNGRMLLADIGHYESEKFTISLLQEKIARKFPTFAVLKTEVNTNPVLYYL